MKVLDPGSTVREGEFATAEGAKGALENYQKEGGYVPNVIAGAVNRMITGQRLLPNQRADFYNRARKLYQGQSEGVENIASQYRSLAERRKLDPQNILFTYGRDFPELEAQAAETPQELTKTIGEKTYVKRGDQWFEQ
jgi:hypothetical protein